jgi:hypothetical protein
MLVIIILFLIIILGYFIYLAYDDYAEFLKPDTQSLHIHKDIYFNRMSQYDLHARGCQSKREYINKYKYSIIPFTLYEKYKIVQLLKEINEMTKPYEKLHKIPWRFLKVKSGIESSMPHTITNIIVLNEDTISLVTDSDDAEDEIQFLKYLLHEKIHLYQKIYPTETQILIRKHWKFLPTNIKHPLLRNNPDTDNCIYTYKNSTMATIYSSEIPKSVDDVVYLSNSADLGFTEKIYETSHPYEIMAYELTEIIMDNTPSESLVGTEGWMELYL